tara:strand:- start:205 stop:462 length:258 start_codon:yes stop_codon:yes gene_type:complete
MNYNLEVNKIISKIKEKKHRFVLIQLADGLKPRAREIVDKIRKETKAEILIWFGSCYGACDIPLGLKVDLIVQIGHNAFRKVEGW